MPWHVGRSDKCPVSKPFAVIKNSDESIVACHSTAADAEKQMAALYAQETSAKSVNGDVMADVERRYTPGLVEVRAADTGRIGGYGSVFDKLSRNLGGFVEIIAPGAFNKARSDGWPNVVARYNHDSNMVLGTTAGRTLELRIDSTGLWYEVLPPKSRQDILELVSRGDVQHSSFAFRVVPGGDEWGTTDQDYPLRTIREVQLVDVAPVLDPAYPDTTAGLRSFAEHYAVDESEVRSMAQADELRKFIVRTDNRGSASKPKPKMFGPSAVAELLARKSDPWV